MHPGNSEWWARLAHGRWAEGEPAEAERAKSGSSLESTVYSAFAHEQVAIPQLLEKWINT